MESMTDLETRRHFVPEATLPILRELVERKYKQDRLKKTLFIWGAVLLVIFTSGLSYILFKSQFAFYGDFRVFMQYPIIWGIILLLILTYLRFSLARKSYQKAEEDYEALRIECINRSTDLWNTDEEWARRHHVFAFMQAEYDINLYYE